jgi:hypothetical protein
MESGEVLDLGELARQVAASHGASDSALRRQRVADAAQQVRTENSWWLPPPSSLKPPTPSACVVKTMSGLFVRNDASR